MLEPPTGTCSHSIE